MTYLFDATAARNSLVILDGADLAGPPLATVRLPVRVPNGFHGNWLPRISL
jgi:carotenoid cleavage dioxygenase-like enzyme